MVGLVLSRRGRLIGKGIFFVSPVSFDARSPFIAIHAMAFVSDFWAKP
jgi:hypothetical protein